jgi:hypothetical protein
MHLHCKCNVQKEFDICCSAAMVVQRYYFKKHMSTHQIALNIKQLVSFEQFSEKELNLPFHWSVAVPSKASKPSILLLSFLANVTAKDFAAMIDLWQDQCGENIGKLLPLTR